MERRTVLQLLAAATAGLWAGSASAGAFQDPAADPALLPLFPLPLVLLPETNLPLHIFEPRYREMIRDCLENNWEFGILLDEEGSFRSTGCTASISEVLMRFPDGRLNILVRGRRRFEIARLDEEKSYLRGEPRFLADDAAGPADEALRQRAIELHGRLRELIEFEDEAFQDPSLPPTDLQLSYRMMAGVPAPPAWKQELLELRSESERLDRVMRYFAEVIEYLERNPDDRPRSGPQAV